MRLVKIETLETETILRTYMVASEEPLRVIERQIRNDDIKPFLEGATCLEELKILAVKEIEVQSK